jgi:hypothetical protein
LHNRFEQMLTIKITNEEEKYVYLLRKLSESRRFVSILLFFKTFS